MRRFLAVSLTRPRRIKSLVDTNQARRRAVAMRSHQAAGPQPIKPCKKRLLCFIQRPALERDLAQQAQRLAGEPALLTTKLMFELEDRLGQRLHFIDVTTPTDDG